MTISPTCLVNSGSTLNGVDVTELSTVNISLADLAGVKQWSIQCIGTDELHSAATINAGLTIDYVNKTASYTAPAIADSSALIFESKVNNGIDANGVTQPSYTTTFAVYVLTASGYRVGAVNETTEGDTDFGWTAKVNTPIRYSAIPSYTAGTGMVLSGGAYNVQAANDSITINADSIQLKAAYKTLLDSATSAATNSALAQRGASAEIAFGALVATTITGTVVTLNSIVVPESSTFTFSQTTRASNAAVKTFTLTSQAPNASATGTNRNSADIVFNIPAPISGGASGHYNFAFGGTQGIGFYTNDTTGFPSILYNTDGSFDVSGNFNLSADNILTITAGDGTVVVGGLTADSAIITGSITAGSYLVASDTSETRVINTTPQSRTGTPEWEAYIDVEWICTALSGKLIIPLDLPNGSKLTEVMVQITGNNTHILGTLPANKPVLNIKYLTASTNVVTTIASQTDTSASGGVYGLPHSITVTGMTHIVDKTIRKYFAEIVAESGADALTGAIYYYGINKFTRLAASNVVAD